MPDTDFEFVEQFKYRRRLCVIVKVLNVLSQAAPTGFCHNGYVAVIPRNVRKGYESFGHRIHTEELTYAGKLGFFHKGNIPKNQWFLGFDTLHYWNGEHPRTQTYAHVKRQIMKLADEMIRKRI
jgi:hypothetical protein